MEYSVSGLMHPQYPLPDIKHLIDRLHTKGALRFLDLEISGPVEIIPGVFCEAANAHTEGSMNVHVETADGIATICGDVIYDFNDQIVQPFHEISDGEPRVTGNHGTLEAPGEGARSRSSSNARYLLPVHDRPAKIEHGQIVGRLQDQVPGPIVQSLPRAQLVPGLTPARTGGGDDPHRVRPEFEDADRRLRAGRAGRHRLPVHRRADLAPARAVPPVLRHAGRRAPALGPAQRRARGARGRPTNATA